MKQGISISSHGFGRVWQIPLDRAAERQKETGTKAFERLLKQGRKPQYLWVDKGKELYNKHLKDLLEKHGIKMYLRENEEKSSVCERWNRTINAKMWKQFTVQGNTRYLDILPEILKQYNNTKHSSIKMTPTEAYANNNEGLVYYNLYGNREQLSSRPKFRIGDSVN